MYLCTNYDKSHKTIKEVYTPTRSVQIHMYIYRKFVCVERKMC